MVLNINAFFRNIIEIIILKYITTITSEDNMGRCLKIKSWFSTYYLRDNIIIIIVRVENLRTNRYNSCKTQVERKHFTIIIIILNEGDFLIISYYNNIRCRVKWTVLDVILILCNTYNGTCRFRCLTRFSS